MLTFSLPEAYVQRRQDSSVTPVIYSDET